MFNAENKSSGYWPSPDQQNLLEACLLEADAAREAWEKWKHADIDNLDQGSFRLLPLLSKKLNELQIDDPCLAKLKGVHRHFWVRNQVLFHHMTRLLQIFAADGIRTLVLKGAPLSLLYYGDLGLRPMSDFDILISPGDRDKALRLLRENRWQPIYFPSFDDLSDSYLSFATSHGFRDSDQREIDVHWHLFPTCASQHCDQGLWDRAEPFTYNNLRTLTLSPADHLLHICGHGAAWNEIPPIRWVADAVTIIRATGERLDWDLLVRESQSRALGLALRDALTYLHESFAISVPADCLQKLRSLPHDNIEKFMLRAQNAPLSKRGLGMEFRLLYQTYRHWISRENVPGGFATFLKVMQHTAKKTSLYEMYGYAIRQGFKRFSN